MDINLTIIGEILTFGVLVFITMKYILPPLSKAMEERQQKIADGLAAAERGQNNLEIAQRNATQILNEAHLKAQELLRQTQKETIKILEEAKFYAKQESDKIISASHASIESEKQILKQDLQKYLADLTISATRQVLPKKIDSKINEQLVNDFIEKLV